MLHALGLVHHGSKNRVLQGVEYIFEFKDYSVKLLRRLARIDADGPADPIPILPAYLR